MVRITDFQFSSTNGKNDIHGRMWLPEGRVTGVVQLVHGVAEYLERYHDFASFLAGHGYIVAGDDHLGHGYTVKDRSELGWFGEKDGWDTLIQDEKRLYTLLRGWYPDVPIILFGHSMGSFIARTYMGYYPQDFAACVLSGTGYYNGVLCRTGMALAKRSIAKNGSQYRSEKLQNLAFGGYMRGIESPAGQNDWMCRDAKVIRKYNADPLCSFTATVGLMYDMMKGLDIIRSTRHLEKMNKNMPVLFISGDADPVGAWGKGVKMTAAQFLKTSMRDVTVKLYPGGRHEILNELMKCYNKVVTGVANKI